MYLIDIDIGGTLTDGLFSDGQKVISVKVDTTPHDYTVCFLECLKEGAAAADFTSLQELLENVEILRWSSTITTNVLAERKGPKLGLLVNEGCKEGLYTDGVSPALGKLIEAGNILSLPAGFKDEDLLLLVKKLLENGVRRVCVSLKGAFIDETEEMRIKHILDEQYPDHYLGSVPVQSGSEICRHPDDATRTHYTLLNAYVHGPLAASLFKAEDALKDEYGFIGNLMIGNIEGGVARIAKTKALETLESGPIFGIHASAYYARLYGLEQVVTLDVGGTTSKIGLVINGEVIKTAKTDIIGIPLSLPAILLRSISIGGGSVIRVQDGSITLGPDSMGAYPGPACYGMGGTEPTITDACLLLGYMNPSYFLGGTRELDLAECRRVFSEKVSTPLNLEIDAAAQLVFEKACNQIYLKIAETLQEYGIAKTEELTLFAFGGNGSLFGCGVAESIGIKDVRVFDLGSVFSAFGSSVSDVCHFYQHAFYAPAKSLNGELAKAAHALLEEGRRDLRGEGLNPEKASYMLEANYLAGGTEESLSISFDGGTVDEQLASFNDRWTACSKGDKAPEEVNILHLKVTYPVAKYKPSTFSGGENGSLHKGDRNVSWKTGPTKTLLYEWERLSAGSIIQGPAVIEAAKTTYVLPGDWSMAVDQYKNGKLTR